MQTPQGSGRARLEAQIRRARASLAVERVARAFWPVLSLAMVSVAFWAFGGFMLLAAVWGAAIVALLGAGHAALIWRGARGFRWPGRADAVARLDAVLPGRPIAALGDRIAVGAQDPAAQAVWERHLQRMAERAAAARAARPDLRLAARDPWALRLGAVVALVAALLFARFPAPVDVGIPMGAPEPGAVAAGPSFEAWASPPAYTGRPTIYLTEDTPRALSLPAGSEVTIRVYGDAEAFALEQSVVPPAGEGAAAPALAPVADGILSATFDVAADGAFGLTRSGREVASWEVTVIPDAPPRVAFGGEVTRAVSGAMELPFEASDDYGVASGTARITLDLAAVDRRHGLIPAPEPRQPLVLDLPMPLSGGSAEVAETLTEDLSKHPWAGLPVTITLTAEDAAGQTATAAREALVLPGRRFFDPLARAIVEQRRDLLWSADNATRVGRMLRTVTHAPEDIFDNTTAYMMTRMAIRRLGYAAEGGLTGAERDDVAELLWQAALVVEDGSLSNARERLRRAQERLSDALQNGATEEELAQLMEELRQAMQDYMQQLAQEAMRNPETAQQPQDQNQRTLNQDQLQQMLDEIQRLAEQGQTEQAEAMLRQLSQMLENLQMQMTQGGQGQQGEGQQTLQELQDTLRQQQGLADESFQELQRRFDQGQQGQQGQPGQQGSPQFGQNQPGQGQGQGQPQQGQPGNQPGAGELARRQEALRRMLEDLRGQLPGPGTEEGAEARDRLGQAERQMGEARDNLEQGDLSGALDRQADAMNALREGIRGLGEEMQNQARQNQGDVGQQMGEGSARENRDPLGRPSGARGNIRSDENMLPGADAMRRAQELFDEIRRRSSEQGRPAEELDYLRRLLDRF